MKTRLLLLIALAVVVTNSLQAQLIKSIGIKVGATISDIRLTDVTPVNIGGQLIFLVVNPSVGVFAELMNSDHLSLQTEVMYLRLGGSETRELTVTSINDPAGTASKASITTEIGLHYLQLRFTAQPKYPLGEVVAYADVGPTFSYLLNATNLLSIGNQLSKTQVGYSIGVGFNLSQLLDNSLFIEVKYAGDFRYFYDHPNAKFWNRSWAICIGATL